jgi:hypothetical protein
VQFSMLKTPRASKTPTLTISIMRQSKEVLFMLTIVK